MSRRTVLPHRPLTNAEKQARYRERKKLRETPAITHSLPDNPIEAAAEYSEQNLIVPAGHRLAGQPMIMAAPLKDCLSEIFEKDAAEGAYSVARKNAKSAGCVGLCVAYLDGPLKRPGFRIAVVSINKPKAGEFISQLIAVCQASGINVEVKRSPYPGTVSTRYCDVEVLAATEDAGAASGFDLVICDETGLLPTRRRGYLAGLRSSTSAKDGRMIHISIKGVSDLFREILSNPETIKHVYQAPAGCALDDREAWRAANPLLGTVKSEKYMEQQLKRVLQSPADQNYFRAHDLNQEVDSETEILITPDELNACYADEEDLPPRGGPVVVGVDMGEARSASAVTVIYVSSGRCEVYMAFGDTPSLSDRAALDNAPYLDMYRAGDLWLFDGKVTPLDLFVKKVFAEIEGEVLAVGSDNYKIEELRSELGKHGVPEVQCLTGLKRHTRDVRAFTRQILGEKLKIKPSLALTHAVAVHKMKRHDESGNRTLSKRHHSGRIDALASALLACGLYEEYANQPTPEPIEVMYV